MNVNVKKTVGVVWLLLFMIFGCAPNNTSHVTPQSISTTTLPPTTITETAFEPTSTNQWDVSNILDRFIDMAVLPTHEVWTVSTKGSVIQDCLEYRGLANHHIENLRLRLNAIDFISSDDGWLVGSFAQIYHWDGETWKSVVPLDLQSRIRLTDIDFADTNNGWTVGCDTERNTGEYKAVLLHWNGEVWENVSLLDSVGREDFCLTSIDVISDINAWAVGYGYFTQGVALHWNGSSWVEISAPEKMTSAHSVSATSQNDVWVCSSNSVTEEDIFHWNGQGWSHMKLPISIGLSNIDKSSAILAISQDDVWAGGRALFHWDGSKWNDISYNGAKGNIVNIEITPDGNVWALTDSGIILQLHK